MSSLDAPTHLLVALCTLPLASLPSTLANPPVHDTLCALLAHSKPSSADVQQRQLLHAVVARAAPLKGALAGPQGIRLLALYLAAFLSTNARAAPKVVEDALAANVRLAEQVRSIGADAVREVSSAHEDGEAAKTVLALVRGTVQCFSPTAAGAKGGDAAKQVLEALAGEYERVVASSQSNSLRLDLLETSHALMQTVASALTSSTISTTSSTALEALHSLLLVLLPPSKSPTNLARALQVHYSLSNALTDAVQGSVGPVARQVKDLIGGLKRAASGDEAEKEERGWIARLARERKVGGAAERDVGLGTRDKEENLTRAAAANAERSGDGLMAAEKEAEIASAISHLLDLFPHLSSPFLRACLLHPTFSAPTLEVRTERIVAALLDDAPLPADLARLRDGAATPEPAPKPTPSPPSPPPQATAPKVERRNIYDDDALFSRGTLLVGGKDRKLASQNKTTRPALKLDESLKASIIALAEAPSSDEEEGEEGEAFLEDGAEDGGARVRVGDGEPKDQTDEDEESEEVAMGDGPQGGGTTAGSSAPTTASRFSSIYSPATLLTLESTYLRSPALFNRDAATRRGKERKALREKTGLGDEQIEGWKVMLERDPKKLQKLADKHTDLAATSNHPASQRPSKSSTSDSQTSSSSAPPPQQHRGPPRAGGESGRGGGRGRGRSDGGRKTSDRATRGRDRKLAKFLGPGGGGAA